MRTVYALRAFYPGKRVAIDSCDESNRATGVIALDERFYRKHEGKAQRIDRHALHVEEFASFPTAPITDDPQKFAEWALLPEGWSLQ